MVALLHYQVGRLKNSNLRNCNLVFLFVSEAGKLALQYTRAEEDEDDTNIVLQEDEESTIEVSEEVARS